MRIHAVFVHSFSRALVRAQPLECSCLAPRYRTMRALAVTDCARSSWRTRDAPDWRTS
jgi:hypothetical protein